VLILTGSEDAAHQRAFALRDVLPDAELVTLVGAGHACQLEQPWEFDRHLLDFIDRRVGLPNIARRHSTPDTDPRPAMVEPIRYLVAAIRARASA
jgi:hypothetical protein